MSVKLMSTSADDVMTIICNITFYSIAHCTHCNTQDMREQITEKEMTGQMKSVTFTARFCDLARKLKLV